MAKDKTAAEPTVKDEERDDGTPLAASSTVAQGDAANAPADVEVEDQSHVRGTTSQSEDLPIGAAAEEVSEHVIPNLTAVQPTGLATGQVNTDEATDKQLSAFLKVSGYKKVDVLASSKTRRTFVTSNGGKYELSPKGTKVRVLSGPIPPGPAEKEGDEE